MSTFDGYVKEFPNIRIDYFRSHPDKKPPAACFLSHVHSDHLLGLDSLKMPFVYCSATTRRLLLRMEKYPHRINFAKGILESRKQHYRHLKSVLRALPLHTSTELELGPKLKIKVTLIDSNHCPGSVMFLIEDDSKAILYTGDVRAEPWWVSSIVQNPFLLPYTFGLRFLDCIYLDTTFSTHDNSYRHFPTKTDGLKELLGKVAQFPEGTTFYFRAWTLGYEQVWMALSSFLRSQVHVDDYQINLFAGIVDNGRDGYSMFEGPGLVGFPVGNHIHPGCLTRESAALIHSCEPWMPCHAELMKNNVVWITPIVSRLDDGTELLELGAGGGFGDLHQMSELDLNDASTLEAFQMLCRDVLKDQEAVEEIERAMQALRKAGSFTLSLDGLGLDTREEIPLKEFARLVSKREFLCGTDSWKKTSDADIEMRQAEKDHVIHFPFPRHSSYQELRDFVSVFRPKDICACTVDLENWTEDMTMSSLFGDLCSEEVFFHDKEVETEVREVRGRRELEKRLKRKRQGGSQQNEDEMDTSPEGEYQSAPTSLRRGIEKGIARSESDDAAMGDEEDSISQRPLEPPDPSTLTTGRVEEHPRKKMMEVEDIKAAFLALNSDKDHISKNGAITCSVKESPNGLGDSQESPSLSTFDSQSQDRECLDKLRQLDGVHDSDPILETQERNENKRNRLGVRQEANRAARRALLQGEMGHWNDLNLRSVGRRGHTEEDVEL